MTLQIIKKNIELQSCSENAHAVLTAEKLEWGNSDHISSIIEKHPGGFDVVLGADIYILENFLPNHPFLLFICNISNFNSCILWTLTRRKLPAI